MSIKNKAKDRDDSGRIFRKYTGPGSTWCFNQTPAYWINLYMTRPRRRINKALCRGIVLGSNDWDETPFPLGNRKPHVYYW